MPLAAWLPALPWAVPFLSLLRLADKRPDLARAEPVRGRPLSVIVPARNEAAVIGNVVRSILGGGYDPLELIVVDDRSEDGTAGVVRAIAADDARVRLVEGAALPADWYGKPWACAQGAAIATGRLLLFTDADTTHHPGLHARAVALQEELDADLLTLAPRQRCVTFWERLVMPQIWVLLGVRFHPRVVNRARRRRDLIANGQFLLIRREAYDAIGGHAMVRDEVAEDLALAQAFHAAGRRVRFAFAERHMETRMYHSLRHLAEGWTKNLYLGGRRSYPDEPVLRALVPAGLATAIGFWLLPTLGLALAGAGIAPALLGPALRAWAVSAGFWAVISAHMRIPPWYGLLHPLGAGMALAIVARSTLRGGRRVEWKGRVYGERGAGTGRP
ncbi:MAG TPA: glycosyltransferase [Gemmatimonadales bacterium]|nr:glycosyltransferase [Gemmatimonadales bacterium]